MNNELTEREMLAMAAKAAGNIWLIRNANTGETYYGVCEVDGHFHGSSPQWNPITDDGDALRLAVKLNLDIRYDSYDAGIAVIVGAAWDDAPEATHEIFERDGPRAVRLAITRAAAEIGRNTQGGGE